MSDKFDAYAAEKPLPIAALESIINPRAAATNRAEHQTHQTQGHDKSVTESVAKGKKAQVKDPITGEETTIQRASEIPDPLIQTDNILSKEFPPLDWESHRKKVFQLTENALIQLIVIYTVVPVLFHLLDIPIPLLSSISNSHPNIYILVKHLLTLTLSSFMAYSLIFSLRSKVTEDFDAHAWHSERLRGLSGNQDLNHDGKISANERVLESAEWLNCLLRGVWPIVNPALFKSTADVLEDVMQSSAPTFVHTVRINDINQGENSFRVTALRSLPDIDVVGVFDDENMKDRQQLDHVNIEISFAYQALPSGSTAGSKANNPHLMVEFFLGMRGVWGFSLPVWVELIGASGTARARLELIPNPPFVKKTIVTLMGLPRVSIRVIPMARSLPNIMDLPFISRFLSKAMDATCAEYVAPKSLTLDLQRLISGDDVKKDTDAMGVIIVHIHRARGIAEADANGSDSYVTVAYSRQGKPLYSTRIVKGDLNPVFEEMAAVTIDPNSVRIRESLSMQLWDSDRSSADDMLGHVDVDLLELIHNKNTPTRRRSSLLSPNSRKRPGMLEYTVGYFEKIAPTKAFATDGTDPAIPEDLRQHPAFRDTRKVALNDLEAAVLTTPPDPAWPSGILSVQVHEIRGLDFKHAGREGESIQGRRKPWQDEDAEVQEEGDALPSSYCTMWDSAINDELIYSTLVKPMTSRPTFNAGTERFIRDWRTAHINVVVRDSRMRENDPILGMVFLKLSDIFINASELTRSFPIEHGIGCGSARVSVLFRPVKVTLSSQLLGFDTGMLCVRCVTLQAGSESELTVLKKWEVHLDTNASEQKISRKQLQQLADGVVTWHKGDRPVELAVWQRYRSALYVSFKDSASVITSGKKALAVLWLRDLVDGEDSVLELPLWRTDDYSRLKQNYIPPDGNLDAWDSDRERLNRVGTVRLELVFRPGITDAHGKRMGKGDTERRRIRDEVDRREAAGMNEKVGQHSGMGGGDGEENTTVKQEDMDIDDREGEENLARESNVDGSNSDDEASGTLMKKLKEWKQHEHELHREHKGIMQMKPARTAAWLKDNVEEVGQKVKEKFSRKARHPEVEKEG